MAKIEKPKQVKTRKHIARQQREARQTRVIVIVTIAIGVIILGLIGYGLIDQLIIRPRKPIAKVGDEIITLKEFESTVKYQRVQTLNQSYQYYTYYQYLGEYGQNFLTTAQQLASGLTQHISFGEEVLNSMIDNILIREEAAARGMTASEEEIDQALQAAFGFFPDGTPTPTTTATILSTPTLSETQLALITLTSTPTATDLPTETPEVSPTLSSESETEADESEEAQTSENSEDDQPDAGEESPSVAEEEIETTPTPEITPTITLTPTPYTTEIYAQNIDQFNELYRIYKFNFKDLREFFEVEILRQKLVEEISKDLDLFKDEVWARHILLETEEEAQEVLQLLKDGGDWHELAAEYSTDTSNKDQGGDLGWFDNATMVQEFSEVAFNLEIGEISEPVETTFGFHIIQVLGKRESQIPPSEFESDKANAFEAWLSDKRNSRNDIEIYDNWEQYVPDTPQVPTEYLSELYQVMPSIDN